MSIIIIASINILLNLSCSCYSNAFLSPSPSPYKHEYVYVQRRPIPIPSLQRHSSYQDNVDHENGSNINLEQKQKYSAIRKGEIYIQHNFLTPDEITVLRHDIARLRQQQHNQSSFKPSGLSNRVKGDDNIFGSSDRLTCTLHGDNTHTIVSNVLGSKFDNLKYDLETSLSTALVSDNGRRDQQETTISAKDKDGDNSNSMPLSQSPHPLELELEEMYYSISPAGSSLPRHNDERHEDTKGDKGWSTDTRRSISWLLYLNENDWGSGGDSGGNEIGDDDTTYSGKGGELRAYCRQCSSDLNVQCGSHDGNIQVGWLRETTLEQARRMQQHRQKQEGQSSFQSTENCANADSNSPSLLNDVDGFEFEPIFLDSWVKIPVATDTARDADEIHDTDDAYLQWQAMSALYRIKRNNTLLVKSTEERVAGDVNVEGREYLSKPFGPNSPSWPSQINLEPADFAQALAAQLFSISEYYNNETSSIHDNDHHDDKNHQAKCTNGKESLQSRFVGTEDIHILNQQPSMMSVVDVVPTGGTLVLFDSVAVPHEVLEVKGGERLAIAGWFHERQQDFPDWYGT